MPADDFEATEDPLRNPKFIKIIDDEEEECGAGVDYRRMFKGYPIFDLILNVSARTRKSSKRFRRGERKISNLMVRLNSGLFFKKEEMQCTRLCPLMRDCSSSLFRSKGQENRSRLWSVD